MIPQGRFWGDSLRKRRQSLCAGLLSSSFREEEKNRFFPEIAGFFFFQLKSYSKSKRFSGRRKNTHAAAIFSSSLKQIKVQKNNNKPLPTVVVLPSI
jgi:hypothetical protein